MITELVNFKKLNSTTEDQLKEKSEALVDFQKQQDGYINCELIKSVEKNSWYYIYHFESMEKVMAIGDKLRKSQAFLDLMPLLVPESIQVSFYNQLRFW